MDLTAQMLKQVALDVTGSTEIPFGEHVIDYSQVRRLTMQEAVGDHTLKGIALVERFENEVEKTLIQPTFIYDFPVEVSPLSKNKPEDPSLVERFELYVGGMEIANAYTELNDPQEQRRRFDLQVAMRAKGDEESQPMDEDFLRALSYAMPPTAGEGIGVDRLVMLMTNSRSIRDVILFPLLRPETEIGIADRLRRLDV